MKRILLAIVAIAVICGKAFAQKTTKVEAPFGVVKIKECSVPERVVRVQGVQEVQGVQGVQEVHPSASSGTSVQAIQIAVDECARLGGGHVVVPAGTWLSGPIHLRSNIDLHLEKGAVIEFLDDKDLYLPAVQTSWEGVECMNFSPLIYAFGCKNISITGEGTIKSRMDFWRTWFSRPASHIEATRKLYEWCSFDTPVEERHAELDGFQFRPHLIQFNRCENILLEGVKIRESPFWTIHMLLCKNGIARNLDVYAHGHNNDGIDLEMTQNFLVENCRFDQGDDAVVIKSGRNQDAWRLNTPSKNIVVRDCDIVHGHTLLGLGSELSGGIENVHMTRCKASGMVHRVMYLKTNHRRGGKVKNIYLDNCQVDTARYGVMEIATDVLYQWKDFPTYKIAITKIENLQMSDVSCKQAGIRYRMIGDERLPAKKIRMRNVSIDTVLDPTSITRNVELTDE